MASADPMGLSKTWELSLYELHRTPQEAITDSTEIAVSPRSLHSELMCPICLDMLKKTMTTKECLHRLVLAESTFLFRFLIAMFVLGFVRTVLSLLFVPVIKNARLVEKNWCQNVHCVLIRILIY